MRHLFICDVSFADFIGKGRRCANCDNWGNCTGLGLNCESLTKRILFFVVDLAPTKIFRGLIEWLTIFIEETCFTELFSKASLKICYAPKTPRLIQWALRRPAVVSGTKSCHSCVYLYTLHRLFEIVWLIAEEWKIPWFLVVKFEMLASTNEFGPDSGGRLKVYFLEIKVVCLT